MVETVEFLNPVEVRVLGCLIEKEITTPDYYPLTLNGLTNACNQSSNRDPVVAYDEQTVIRALDTLREKKLAVMTTGGLNRVAKYAQRLVEALELDGAQRAVVCELMLRGPQTVGELRSRGSRMHAFAGLAEVESALGALAAREPQPLVRKLPRQAGFKESRYVQLLGVYEEPQAAGSTAVAAQEMAAQPVAPAGGTEPDRLARMEEEFAALRREVASLREELDGFRRQFQ